MNFSPDYATAIIVVVSLLFGAHYAPIDWLVEKVHPTIPYVIGSLCILIGFASWQIRAGNFSVVLGLLGLYIAGGLTVAGAYKFDDFATWIRNHRLDKNQ